MSERLTSNSNRNEVYLERYIPNFTIDIAERAKETSSLFLSKPETLEPFYRKLADQLYILEVNGNYESKQLLTEYIENVTNRISSLSKKEWYKRSKTNISIEDARVLLDFLPTQKSDSSNYLNNKFSKIAEYFSRGYINTRFEGGRIPDWRGSLETLHLFLKASISGDEIDIDRITAFYEILTGEYKSVNKINDIAWKSIFLGHRSADPEDEKYIGLATDVDNANSMIAEIIGRADEYVKTVNNYNDLALIFDFTRDMSWTLGLDPNTKKGREAFRHMLLKSSFKDSENFRYYEINTSLEDIANRKVDPDIIEVAHLAGKNVMRYGALMDAINDRYVNRVEGINMRDFVVPQDSKGEYIFPYNIKFRSSVDLSKLLIYSGKKQLTDKIRSLAEIESKQHPKKWRLMRFAQQGLQGFFIVNPDILPEGIDKPAVKSEWIKSILDRHGIDNNMLLEHYSEYSDHEFSHSFTGRNYSIHIIKEEYSALTPIETLMEIHLPSRYSGERKYDVLSVVSSLKRSIPSEFRKNLTLAGYEYELTDHIDIPGVVDKVVLRKKRNGGIEFIVDFVPNLEVVPDHPKPRTKGSIIFDTNGSRGDTLIKFDEAVDNLPVNHKWVLESVILHLLKDSVSLSHKELVDSLYSDEIGIEEIERFKEEFSIPGRLVHIGARKADGTPGTHTEYAEENFKQAMKEMGMDTEGISLAQVNQDHKNKNPECKLNLTWNKGYEPDITPPPVRREPPKTVVL